MQVTSLHSIGSSLQRSSPDVTCKFVVGDDRCKKELPSKIILDLCGGTGEWSRPYKEAGYDVRLITLPEHNVFDYAPPLGVYGVLAAPTCTMFSTARTTAKTPRDFRGGMKLVIRCLEIIWECKYQENSPLKFWALENPQGLLRRFLGRPPFTFHPYDFGDRYSKRTDLWGDYEIPRKKPVVLTAKEIADCSINNRPLPPLPTGYVLPTDFNQVAARRSMTAQGFAKAFFRANK